MDWKVLLGSKTFWTGVVTVGYGIYRLVSGDTTGSTDIAVGLGMIFTRNAISQK